MHCATLGAGERRVSGAVFLFAAPEARCLLRILSYVLTCWLRLAVSMTHCIYGYETNNKASYAQGEDKQYRHGFSTPPYVTLWLS